MFQFPMITASTKTVASSSIHFLSNCYVYVVKCGYFKFPNSTAKSYHKNFEVEFENKKQTRIPFQHFLKAKLETKHLAGGTNF